RPGSAPPAPGATTAAGAGGAASPLRLGLALVAVVGGPIGYSLVRWNGLELRPAAHVGVVQPNVPEHIKLGDRDVAADSARRATETLVRPWIEGGEELDLVVLPETALPVFIDPLPSRGYGGRPDFERWAVELARATDARVLFGAIGSDDRSDGSYEYFNSAFLVSPEGGRIARYDKRFLVPVVERVPFVNPRWFADFRYFGGFGVGEIAPPLPANGASFGVLICYESIFTQLTRHYRLHGADFMVNITNDAWFGREVWWSRSSALWQHPAHLVMRAIEARIGVARSANTGISELVDPLGRVSRATELFEAAAFTGDVLTTDGRTLYVRYGDTVGWTAALAAIMGLLAAILRARKSEAIVSGPPRKETPGRERGGSG
ncbi:MAG: apolipoprotein N-acyltransferase, partial [Gemmatimonadota bacterium]